MKVIHILLIIIFILFTILGVKVYNSNKEPEYSISDIQEILDKANHIKNYECIIDNKYGLVFKSYKKKENIICIEDRSTKRIYNYELNSYLSVCDDGVKGEKFYIEDTISHSEYKFTSSNSLSCGISPHNILLVESIDIIKIKEVKFDGNNCLKIIFKIAPEDTPAYFQNGKGYFKGNLWLNKDNGLIMKIQDAETKREFEPEYKFDTVTDKDLNPDLSHYRKLPKYN